MLEKIVKTKNPVFWVLIHALLGLGCALLREVFVLWFYVVALSSFNIINKGGKNQRVVNLLYLVAYFASLELLSRMAHGWAYRVPWEFGKYVVFFGALYAILVLNARRGVKGYALFFLLIPALFLGGAGRDLNWRDLVFNLLGPVSVAFAVVAYTQIKVTRTQFRQILKLILYPAISVLAYVVIKTPDLDSLEFELGANFKTTGGYGSNQVSTVLGLGLFLTFVFWINKWELTGNRTADLVIMLGFAFQGLISFSRGGMVGGLVGIIVVVFLISRAGASLIKRYGLPTIGKYVLPALIGLVVIFQVADAVTGGLLSLRYQGETNATLTGSREVDLNTLTTGRFSIFQEDVEIWQKHFVFGAGAGMSQYLRSGSLQSDKPIASHVELSRLLADHGLLGLTWFVVLLLIGFKLLNFRTNAKYQGILLAFYAIAVYTTFHAATRTYVTPLLIGISLLNIVDIKEPDTLGDVPAHKRARINPALVTS